MTQSNSEMVFSHIFARYGGLLKDYEAYLPGTAGYQRLLAEWHVDFPIINDWPTVSAGDLYINFVNNPSFNAIATRINGREFIGVFAGAVDFLFRCFLSFMADPETLPQVGDVAGERASTTSWSDLNPIIDPEKFSIPRDTTRRDSAGLLALHAAHFLLHHEFTHIFRGHLILLEEEFSLSEYLELPAIPLTRDEARVRRALELDADHGAATIRLEEFRKASRSGNLPYLDVVGPDMAWALCIAMVFHIMWAQDVVARRDEERTHPSPATRWLSIMFSAENGEMMFSKALNRDRILNGFGQVHRWWRAHSLPLVETVSLDNAAPELEALREDLRALSPRIVNYAAQRVEMFRTRIGGGAQHRH
jgi:hypothetical protein